MDVGIVPSRHARTTRIPTWRNIGVRSVKNGQYLTAPIEMLYLWVRARNVAEQVELIAVPLDQKGYVARNNSIDAMADQQTKIMLIDVLDQHLEARFSKGGGQINHQSSPRAERRTDHSICLRAGAASSPAPD